MRRSQLVSVVRSLLPSHTNWLDNENIRLKDGKTVLMLVATVPNPRLAVKLIDLVCPHTANFCARDSQGRNVIMDACDHGVHVSVLSRLVTWAKRERFNLVTLMAKHDTDGLDAVELAIRKGHGALASWLLDQRVPSTYYASLCPHYPLEVLQLAIRTGNEECVKIICANERVVADLQPGLTEGLNRRVRRMQRLTAKKRLFNVYTCIEAAVRYDMPEVVTTVYKMNPQETHQAVWYAVSKLKSKSPVPVLPILRRMAKSYLLDKSWTQVGLIVLLRQWKSVDASTRSSWKQVKRLWKRERRAISSHPLAALPSDMILMVFSFLLPSHRSEMKETRFLVEY